MADRYTKHIAIAPGDYPLKFKEVVDGAAPEGVYVAPIMALEPGSIGGGGAAGLTDAQLRATPVPVSGTVNVGNFPATQAVSGTFWQVTQPVSISAALDVSDRAARLLGHVTVDNASLAVTGAFFQGTQPVSGTVTVANPTTNPETGLAKDATFTAAVGSSSDTPPAYTVLDQLTKLRKAAEASLKVVQQLVILQTPAPRPKVQTTLLHRS